MPRHTNRRLAALGSLALTLLAFALATALLIADPWRGVISFILLGLALGCAWGGVVRRRAPRAIGIGLAMLLAGADALLVIGGHLLLVICAIAAMSLALGLAAVAFRIRVPLPAAQRVLHPVMFCNSRAGGGKVARFNLREEARARGIEPIELTPEKPLAELVRQALDRGADALAVAGGDGSQALVASIAAERSVAFACIPAGTRNHFALDLGVEREDVVGALDALVDGGERRVDLAEVNGRIFVNNVSLGVYGEAVQRAGYRGAKLRTLFETIPDVLGPGLRPDFHWLGPDGVEHAGAAALIISNNPYRFIPPMGAEPSRPQLNAGVLGIAALDPTGPRTWSAPSFQVDARSAVPAGIDGEAVVLTAPLRFRSLPGALRCRIARHDPGASPSAFEPERFTDWVRALCSIAAGRDPGVKLTE